MSHKDIKENIDKILLYRKIARDKLLLLQNLNEDKIDLTNNLTKICVLGSSSRGGTGVTSELLQWQGSDCSKPKGRVLSLPGEEKPHLVLAGLAFPSRDDCFDDLDELDAKLPNVSILLEEIKSEIGYPIVSCKNLRIYAIQLYRRLLLQWPIPFLNIDVDDAIERLNNELQKCFPIEYIDSLENRRLALKCCVSCFPFILPDYYDCWPTHNVSNSAELAAEFWSIEETPFIFPAPWKNASLNELTQGVLLLRDPSNAWRLPFWRNVFKLQDLKILHLVRDSCESIQGLCDGWNYRYGFQTMPSSSNIKIVGYNDCQDEDFGWKSRRLNFSICKSLSEKIFENKADLSLVQICAYQWKDAHEKILRESEYLNLQRIQIDFSDIRRNTIESFKKICSFLDLEISKSGIDFTKTFNDHWVMVTPLAMSKGHDRWKRSSFSEEIIALHTCGYFDKVNFDLALKPFKMRIEVNLSEA